MQNKALGVKGLIMREDKALVLFKSNGELDLPGGRIEGGEEPVESLYREIFEETGLAVKVIAPLLQWSFLKDSALLVRGITYYCQYLSGRVILSNEHSEYDWFERYTVEWLNWKRPFLENGGHDLFGCLQRQDDRSQKPYKESSCYGGNQHKRPNTNTPRQNKQWKTV